MLAESGITRQSLGRDAFLEKVWEWKNKYGNTITNQMRQV
jgi:valyl-tRNA synthetase